MEHSEAIEALVREKVAKLDASPDYIMGCRVVVEPAGRGTSSKATSTKCGSVSK